MEVLDLFPGVFRLFVYGDVDGVDLESLVESFHVLSVGACYACNRPECVVLSCLEVVELRVR